MTGEELKQRNIAVMGDDLGAQYTALFSEVHRAVFVLERISQTLSGHRAYCCNWK